MSVKAEKRIIAARAAPTATDNEALPASEAAATSSGELKMAIVWRDARLLLIGLWLGAAIFFSFAVAPSAFAVLPARELAGALVTRTLNIINTGGFLLSLLLLAGAFPFKKMITQRAFLIEVIALCLLAMMTGIGQWVISARLSGLRAAMGRPIDEVAANDPLRVAFNSLHGYSVMALGIGMIAAIVAFLLIVRRVRR